MLILPLDHISETKSDFKPLQYNTCSGLYLPNFILPTPHSIVLYLNIMVLDCDVIVLKCDNSIALQQYLMHPIWDSVQMWSEVSV